MPGGEAQTSRYRLWRGHAGAEVSCVWRNRTPVRAAWCAETIPSASSALPKDP